MKPKYDKGFNLVSIKADKGYQWVEDTIEPIPVINPKTSETSLPHDVAHFAEDFAFEEFYNCFRPYSKWFQKKYYVDRREAFPFDTKMPDTYHGLNLRQTKMDLHDPHLVHRNQEVKEEIKENLLTLFNKTGIGRLPKFDKEGHVDYESIKYPGEGITFDDLLEEFVALDLAIGNKEPFMPPKDYVVGRLNFFEMKLVYDNGYCPTYTDFFGAVWHGLVQKEWGYKPKTCQWCDVFMLSVRKDALVCPPPRKCKNNVTNYKISLKREEERRKKNANKKAK